MSMQMTFNIFMNVIAAIQTMSYRHGIFVDTTPLCNNLTCDGDLPHTACNLFNPHERCFGFEMMDMSRKEISTMILGHNGIRNKISKDWGIANMNIIHWSRELERLSKYFLINCSPHRDKCDFLVSKDITIGQNLYFSKAHPGPRWVGRAIRDWYFKLGYEIKNWDQFKEAQHQNVSLNEFAQMIWPTTEFLGCAAARMFDGYLVSCYYHPAVTNRWNDFVLADGCTGCPRERPTCSRVFRKLCGLDISYGTAGQHSKFEITLFTCIFFSLLYFFFWMF